MKLSVTRHADRQQVGQQLLASALVAQMVNVIRASRVAFFTFAAAAFENGTPL
jgi:hypothetical protein